MKIREIPEKIGNIDVSLSSVETLIIKLYKFVFYLFMLFLVFVLPVALYFEEGGLTETIVLAGSWIFGTLVADRLIRFFAKRIRDMLVS